MRAGVRVGRRAASDWGIRGALLMRESRSKAAGLGVLVSHESKRGGIRTPPHICKDLDSVGCRSTWRHFTLLVLIKHSLQQTRIPICDFPSYAHFAQSLHENVYGLRDTMVDRASMNEKDTCCYPQRESKGWSELVEHICSSDICAHRHDILDGGLTSLCCRVGWSEDWRSCGRVGR